MIGIIADFGTAHIVKEFFELFKTPWEFYKPGRAYEVLICSGGDRGNLDAGLTVLYGEERNRAGSPSDIDLGLKREPVELVWRDIAFPVYTRVSTLEKPGDVFLTSKRGAIGTIVQRKTQTLAYIGYDLFREIGHLLSVGQAPEYSRVPTLEIHIAILRYLMQRSDVPFMEIPPVPHGCDCIACLTHDVDFGGIKNYKLDHTVFGFLYRATWRSFMDALKGRSTWRSLRKNLQAVLSLPAVYAGLARDFWIQFDRYLEIEKGVKSTFFFLPFKGVRGRSRLRAVPRKRAAGYDFHDLLDHIRTILSKGGEIGLHGIDAWHNAETGRKEASEIFRATGIPVHGGRIHWLYFHTDSPRVLEEAGLEFDSTLGYNETIGFFAGTAQVYRPFGVERLLEIPLLIQDTALFYSGRMGLQEEEAWPLCKDVLEKVMEFGGVYVVNWHDRSLAPERSWDDFYIRLLSELKSRRVWFGTCSEVAQWFRKRRAVQFDRDERDQSGARVTVRGLADDGGPDLSLRIYDRQGRGGLHDVPARAPIEMALQGVAGQADRSFSFHGKGSQENWG